MTKKNINRILIVAVALIWGVLIYKFVNSMFAPNTIEGDAIASQKTLDIPQITKDTFNLKTYKRDPFLGTLNSRPKVSKRNNAIKKVDKKEAPINQKWPKIEYLGFVKEEKSNDPLLLVKIDNRLYRKKANGEFIEGLTIITFYKDSLQVDYNNEKRMIKKN